MQAKASRLQVLQSSYLREKPFKLAILSVTIKELDICSAAITYFPVLKQAFPKQSLLLLAQLQRSKICNIIKKATVNPFYVWISLSIKSNVLNMVWVS
jgi:hypothetical protein